MSTSLQNLLDSSKPTLIGLSKDELREFLKGRGYPDFRAQQLWDWIYKHGAQEFECMTNVGKDLRAMLVEVASLGRPQIVTTQTAADGTVKWLLRFTDGQEAETVFIPETNRGTLCLSSQVGCTLTCKFCHTGTQLWVRNLTPSEIVGQVMVAKDWLCEWPTLPEGRRITNVVYMGMGEPLYNYESIAKATKILMDGTGIAISKRRITLSTSGVVPMIERCGRELGINLAISLHATRDTLRNDLMPLNKKYPLRTLLEACRNYPTSSNARRITFEYLMLEGVNDSPQEARALVKLLHGIPAKLNLIPFNPWPGSPYACSTPETIEHFAQIIMAAGYPAPVRTPRGGDILAACGQLKSESLRLRKMRDSHK